MERLSALLIFSVTERFKMVFYIVCEDNGKTVMTTKISRYT